MDLKQRIDCMVRLGAYLSSDDPALADARERAFAQNAWFIPEFVGLAIRNICTAFLEREKLEPWVAAYESRIRAVAPQTVGITLAGNIPMVGFHDFLCGFICGHHLLLKASSKDNVLLPHCVDKLKAWVPDLNEAIRFTTMLKGCDAYIATGNNSTARYFEYYFARYPHIIRRNRTSVAVLQGDETTAELALLADDVFQYFGLGCRNVTKLYVPRQYDFIPLLEAFRRYAFVTDVHRYKNNIDYNLALHILNHTFYMSSDNMIISENDQVFSPVGVLHYTAYDDEAALLHTLRQHPDVQAIIGRNGVPFGSSQTPSLTDYADGVDTMAFLCGL